MREIKFRMWDLKMYSWDDLMHIEDYDLDLYAILSGHYSGLIPMQYTGLKDRNGVEIYEGDIVTWGDIEGYIEMSGTRVAVVDMSVPEDGLTFDTFKPFKNRFKIGNFMYAQSTHRCMTVIGNIYENPELLEE